MGDVFGDPKRLAQFYVEPNCQHHNPADDEDEDCASDIQMPIYGWLNKYLSRDSPHEDGRNQCLVLADAGMGKSSFFLMIKLSHLYSKWPKTYKCELLKLSEKTLAEVAKIKDKPNTILLLDALDEDPCAVNNIKNRIHEILKSTTKFKKVLISCRTQYLPEGDSSPFDHLGKLHIKGFKCPSIFISLFDDYQVTEYLGKRFPDAPAKQEKGDQIIKQMGSLRFRPLLLSYIEDFIDVGNKSFSVYDIYGHLVDAWLSREQRKFNEYLGRDVTSSQLLDVCVQVSIYMQKGLDQVLIPEDLERLINENEDFRLLSLMDIGGRSLLNKNSDGAYRFSHFTIQEFLITYAVVNDAIEDTDLTRATSQIVDFLHGFDWSKIRVDKLFFDGLVLKNFKFKNLTFDEGSFENCNLQNITIENSEFNKSNFRGTVWKDCIIRNSNFEGSNFRNSKFSRCNVQQSKFKDSIFIKSDFKETDYKSVDFTLSRFANSKHHLCKFFECLFHDTIMDDAALTGSLYEGCEFADTSTERTEIDSTFVGMDISSFNEDSTDFSKARFL